MHKVTVGLLDIGFLLRRYAGNTYGSLIPLCVFLSLDL